MKFRLVKKITIESYRYSQNRLTDHEWLSHRSPASNLFFPRHEPNKSLPNEFKHPDNISIMEVIGDGIRLDLEQILEFEHDKQSNSFKCSIPREKLNGEVKISFQRYVGLEKVIQVDCDKTKGKALKEYADGPIP